MADAPKTPARGAVAMVLDGEIAKLKADIDKLTQDGADQKQIAELQNLLRARAIQRAKLG